jgi:hypothetical protein
MNKEDAPWRNWLARLAVILQLPGGCQFESDWGSFLFFFVDIHSFRTLLLKYNQWHHLSMSSKNPHLIIVGSLHYEQC